MTFRSRTGAAYFKWIAIFAAAALLHGCGGGDDDAAPAASTSDIRAASSRPGVSPFIAFVELTGGSLDQLATVRYTIRGKPGTASKPVQVSFALAALQRRGYFVPASRTLTLPVFGLYANHRNEVDATLVFKDGSSQDLPVQVSTAAYADSNSLLNTPVVHRARAPGEALGFDYFAMKSWLGAPVVLDSDGQIRWTVPRSGVSISSTFLDNAFLVGQGDGRKIARIDLDGATTESEIPEGFYTQFHHNLDRGKFGVLAELDAQVGGVPRVESVLVDMTPSGIVIREWDFAKILGDYMRAQGDDPSSFIRESVDWFHMNAAVYDPRDDTVVVSSRENFLIKVGYQTGEIHWIFGDPTKFWHGFPSLRAKALTLTAGGLYPLGQHAVSIRADGQVMVFNNGAESFNQPVGAPVGESRPYSAVSVYRIDAGAGTATETWRYDAGQAIHSWICSSVYEVADTSLLIDYASVNAGASTRVVGLDASRRVVFDFEYATPAPCRAAWNAMPVAFDSMAFE